VTDVLTPEQRRFNMSRIRARDTLPELTVRRGLYANGLRYRLHDRRLPGRPDIVLGRYRTVVFVHGCFWHAHGCYLSKIPKTRQEFWRRKMETNKARDRKVLTALQTDGWRVLMIWECALRGRARRKAPQVSARATRFIRHGKRHLLEIKGV
jgi:DNA mismatch endonuclease, patch repair protein